MDLNIYAFAVRWIKSFERFLFVHYFNSYFWPGVMGRYPFGALFSNDWFFCALIILHKKLLNLFNTFKICSKLSGRKIVFRRIHLSIKKVNYCIGSNLRNLYPFQLSDIFFNHIYLLGNYTRIYFREIWRKATKSDHRVMTVVCTRLL